MEFESLRIQRKVLSVAKEKTNLNGFHEFSMPNNQGTPPSINYLAAVHAGETPGKPTTENGIDLS